MTPTDPGTPEPQLSSNLANALNDLGVENAKSFQTLGDILGAIADISAVVGIAAGGAGLIIAAADVVFKIYQTPDELSQAAVALEEFIQEFEDAVARQALLERLTNIQNQTANSETLAQSLPLLANQLPLPGSELIQNLQLSLKAIDALAPPDLSGRGCAGAGLGGPWSFAYHFKTYWNDADSPETTIDQVRGPSQNPPEVVAFNGYGEQAPVAPADGQVFDYSYVLPAYLYVLSVFLAAGVELDPKFKENWTDTVIRPSACLLLSVHDYILDQGLIILQPPAFTDDDFAQWVANFMAGALPFPPAPRGVFPTPDLSGLKLEFGAVEKFSGINNVSLATVYLSQPSGSDLWTKLQIRVLKRAKDVYIAAGLLNVVQMVNSIRRIAGDAVIPAPTYADWSFRRDLAPYWTPQFGGTRYLRDLVSFILETPPNDVPLSPVFPAVSLRNVLGS